MKINKKLIICLVIIFIIFNIYFYSQVNAGVLVNNILSKTQSASLSFNLPGPITTFLHTLLAALQVGVTGWFVIWFTCIGIQYFTVTAASEKAVKKGRLQHVFVWGVVAFSAMSVVTIIFDIFS